jgi:hypothetical protein
VDEEEKREKKVEELSFAFSVLRHSYFIEKKCNPSLITKKYSFFFKTYYYYYNFHAKCSK